MFDGVDFNFLNKEYNIINNTVEVSYKTSDVIHSSRKEHIGIGVIISGSAHICADEKIDSPVLRSLSPGSTFGVASLFSDGNYSTTVIANEDCTVSYIPKYFIEELCKNEASVSLNYVKFLSGRVTFLNRKVSIYTKGSTEAKLAYFLYDCEADSNGKIVVNYSQLADILNIGRASLYRSLDKLCGDGIIERTSKSITIIDRNKLINNF